MVRNYVYVSYGTSCWIQHLERQNPQKAPKGSKRYSVPEIKDRQYLQIIWEGKAKMVRNYVYVSYGISCWIQHLERQNPQKAPKEFKRYSVPEIKDRQCLQIIWEGKAKWYEIMSMFPTALAAESNT